jgi:hypothetical protein
MVLRHDQQIQLFLEMEIINYVTLIFPNSLIKL